MRLIYNGLTVADINTTLILISIIITFITYVYYRYQLHVYLIENPPQKTVDLFIIRIKEEIKLLLKQLIDEIKKQISQVVDQLPIKGLKKTSEKVSEIKQKGLDIIDKIKENKIVETIDDSNLIDKTKQIIEDLPVREIGEKLEETKGIVKDVGGKAKSTVKKGLSFLKKFKRN